MSAPTLKSPRPRSRLQRLATVERLATAITWVFWITAGYTALRVILALTRGGVLGAPALNGQPGPPSLVWVTIAPPLLQHAGSVLIHSGLAHRCDWPAPPPATAFTPSRPPGWCCSWAGGCWPAGW
jgi:hypothetical protein